MRVYGQDDPRTLLAGWRHWQGLSCGCGPRAPRVLHLDLPCGFLDLLTARQLGWKREAVGGASLLKGLELSDTG